MSDRSKNLSILGSTGSIGKQALELVRSAPDRYNVVGLCAGSSWKKLAEQAREFEPDLIGISGEGYEEKLKQRITEGETPSSPPPEVVSGSDALKRVGAMEKAGIVLSAVMGKAGLPGTLAGIRAGKRVALANKESLLVAGSVIRDLTRRHDAELIPVDSEHSSLFQLLNGTPETHVKKVILTASGGPFRTWKRERIREATPEDALNHPTWNMGDKITIDSATLMNKAIEIVEAKHLFEFAPDQIDVVIHPQSRVHAMVELVDGTLMTHMGPPDMKAPIQYAFSYPDRGRSHRKSTDLTDGLDLQFEDPRRDEFPALELGYDVARRGGTSGAVLNGANEVAVEAFLEGRIDFPSISTLVKNVLNDHECIDRPDLDTLLTEEQNARRETEERIRSTSIEQPPVQRETETS